MRNFTNLEKNPFKAYGGGNGNKISVIENNKIYLIKFPSNSKDKKNELSYSNGCISEHIGSTIFNMLGMNAQKTELGYFDINGKRKIVVKCEDFVANSPDKLELIDFASVNNANLSDSSSGRHPELERILDTIEKQQFLDVLELKTHFWDMFIVDAFIGNFDRHSGNWGFIVNNTNKTVELSPIYDCGSCLLPQIDGKTMKNCLENEEEMKARIYTFPNSSIKCDEKKINYYNYITSFQDYDCNLSLIRIYNKIDMEEIECFIDSIECLDSLQKTFYKEYLNQRYSILIKEPALELIKQITIDDIENEEDSLDELER